MSRSRSPAAQLFRQLDAVATPVYLLDDQRRVIYGNAACETWLGVSILPFVGKPCAYHSRAATEEEAPSILCPPPQAFQGEIAEAELGPGPSGGGLVWHAQYLPLKDPLDEVALVLAVLTLARPRASSDDAARLHRLVHDFHTAEARRHTPDHLIGTSPAMQRVRNQLQVALESPASVFIAGPPGSGKEQIAHTLHYRGSKVSGLLVPLACATLSAELLVSTLEAALRAHPCTTADVGVTGTLLFSDIDELPVTAHEVFSRLLTEYQTSLRLVATSSRPLAALLAAAFPAALAHRLATLEINLPPLKDRREDLPLLAQSFLEECNARGGKQLAGIAPEALDMLVQAPWPRNLDDLYEAVAAAHQNAAGPQIAPRDLPERIRLAMEAVPRSTARGDESIKLEAFLADVERELIGRALARAKGNKTKAAKLLGMTRPRLYRRMVQLKLAE